MINFATWFGYQINESLNLLTQTNKNNEGSTVNKCKTESSRKSFRQKEKEKR